MKAHEENPLEKNDLAEGLKALAAKAKSGRSANMRFILLMLALGAVIGAYWYLRGSSKKSESETWRLFDGLGSVDEYDQFAETYANSFPGRAARLQEARILLAQGLQEIMTQAIDATERNKSVAKVEKSRELFLQLATEFPNDLTLRSLAYQGAYKAELSLVGIPKSEGSLTEDRGSVQKAVEYLRDYAKAVGETTTLGEAATKKAAELIEKEAEVKALGASLNNQYAPKPTSDIKLPGDLTSPTDPLKPSEPVAPGKVETPKTETPTKEKPIPPPTVPSKETEPKKDEKK